VSSPSEQAAGAALVPANVISDESVRRALEAVLSSSAFREAEILKRFLRYVVEQTLLGRGDELKEYKLGLEVFGRNPSFDPRLDPVVRMAARRLRSKLSEYYEKEGRQDGFRIDVPKGGYAASFAVPTREPLSLESPFPTTLSPRARPSTIYGLAMLALALSLIASGVVWVLSRKRISPAPAPVIHSVAVLPFQNLSADSSQEYLADGITEALVTDLAQIHALRVISRTSSWSYKGTTKKLPEIARELDVDAVVEGSVVRSGDRVRVTAQLIAAPSDTHLWAQTYDGSMRDLLDLQSRVAQAIVQRVGVSLSPQEQLRLRTTHLVSPEAHEAYLLGRYYWNKRTPDSIIKSLEFFDRATRLDSKSAEAYAAIASAYVTLLASETFPPREMEAKARAAAEKAISLDDALAEPHAALGIVKAVEEYDWAGSAAEFHKAFDRDPNYATAHHWYGYTLMWRGRATEAYDELLTASHLDPLNPTIMVAIDGPLSQLGRYDEAFQQLRKQLEMDPRSYIALWGMGNLYASTRQYDKAIAAYRQALAITPGNPYVMARLCYALGMAGNRSEALRLLHEMQQNRGRKYLSASNEALAYIGLGDRPKALAALEKSYQDRSLQVMGLREPFYDSLRSDPKFNAIAKATGLE
jgi:TolB-like protein/tetratricopeptide (TPR) repeat protein